MLRGSSRTRFRNSLVASLIFYSIISLLETLEVLYDVFASAFHYPPKNGCPGGPRYPRGIAVVG